MPRRIPDYPDAYAPWNSISSIGSIISVVGLFVFIYLLYKSFVSKSNLEIIDGNGVTRSAVKNSLWNTLSFFVSDKEKEEYLISSNTLEFSLDNPIPLHAYTVVPIIAKDIEDSTIKQIYH